MTPDVVYAITAAWTAVRIAQVIAANAKDKRAALRPPRAAKDGAK